MKAGSFKFSLGERVFILGRPGICTVTARGKMNFFSGGSLNLYQVNGAYDGFRTENLLLSESEVRELMEGRR